ncbi:uncharacterized protein BX663DRAFT_526968 [Cokeromyces recurvatus]|uniref:uncharacterized protein n=1 Tax=Cokeromyces recurvatus TaxID=90255 RepID=UPI00221ED3C8|nr:uncharacterized protein BX663DRAFT_526968 [Cokeromyces recurvatus]KAI7897815.1 hypothetical protein BX663DRAFT_526968 [Cokeromyces recurvatus]
MEQPVEELVTLAAERMHNIADIPGEGVGAIDIGVEVRAFLKGYDLFLIMEILKRRLNKRHSANVRSEYEELQFCTVRQFNVIMTGAKKLFNVLRTTTGGCLSSPELILARQIVKNQRPAADLERIFFKQYIMRRGRQNRTLRLLRQKLEENDRFLED